MDNLLKKKLTRARVNQRTFFVFCLFGITLLMSVSCSDLTYISNGNIPLKIAVANNSELTTYTEGKSDFYFWGKFPERAVIDLEDFAHKEGLVFPSNIVIEQSTSWKSFLYTVFTLGLYCPVDFKITILSAKEKRL